MRARGLKHVLSEATLRQLLIKNSASFLIVGSVPYIHVYNDDEVFLAEEFVNSPDGSGGTGNSAAFLLPFPCSEYVSDSCLDKMPVMILNELVS